MTQESVSSRSLSLPLSVLSGLALCQMSRDITNMSKKVIFLLHRIALEDDDTSYIRAAKSGLSKLREVQDTYVSHTHQLAGAHFWRYQRQVSPGLQEYIEALSFVHYLQYGSLIPFQTVQLSLSSPEGVPVCHLNIREPYFFFYFNPSISL